MTTEVPTLKSATTEPAGNTIQPVFKARAFLFTLNQVEKYPELKHLILKLKNCDYFLAAKEIAPTTGHEHIHAYAHFSTPYKLNKKILALRTHIDICRGSPKQNIEYVKKDGNILDEVGEEPHQGKPQTLGELLKLEKLEVPPQYANIWRKFKDEEANDIDIDEWHKDIKVYYIQGPSGAGKTELAKQIVRDNAEKYGRQANPVKYENGFWSGIGNKAKVAIYDDFRDSHMKASEFIHFIDYNTHTLNIKGGNVPNRYNLIIITSVQRLDDIYQNCQGEPRNQWLRRIELINMYPDSENRDENDIDIDEMM